MAAAKTSPFAEIGVTGLKHSAGFIREEFLRQLQGTRGMRMYREMRDNSAEIGAGMGIIEMLIRQVGYTVEPFSQDREDLERAAFVDTCRTDMSTTWPETIAEHLTMLTYGWALNEIVYKKRDGDVNDPTRASKYKDGKIGWRKIPLRAQDSLLRWEFDAEGGAQGMWQLAAPDYQTRLIPIEKALLFRARNERGNPEGRSPLRNAYFAWYFLKKITEIEAIGIARDLAGMPIGWVPVEGFDPDAVPAQKAAYEAMKKIVTTIARGEDEGAMIPLDYQPGTANKKFDLTLLSTGGRRQFDTTAVRSSYKRDIIQTMLHDLVLMGQPGTIQYKGVGVPNLFAVALGGWLDVIVEVYNMFAIPRLMKLNGWPADRCPRLKHGEVQAPDIAAMADFISKVSGAGFRWETDQGVDAQLRRIAGMPPADPNAPPPTAAPAPAQNPDSGGGDDDDADEQAEAAPAASALQKRLRDSRPLRLGEFARFTGYSREQVRKWADAGVIRSVRPGGSSSERRIPSAEAARFCEEQGVQ